MCDGDLPRVHGESDVPDSCVDREGGEPGVERDSGQPVWTRFRDSPQEVRAREPRDEGIGRSGDELRRGGDLEQPSLDEHSDPVGERCCVVEVVCHEQSRQLELLEQLPQLGPDTSTCVGVERREWLVEQEHGRVARERPCQRDPLTLSSRDRRRPNRCEVAYPEALEQLVDAVLTAERHVRAHSHVRKERVLLEHEADATALGRKVDARLRVEPGLTAQLDAPALGALQPRDRAEHARLPGSRRPDEGDGLAAPNLER